MIMIGLIFRSKATQLNSYQALFLKVPSRGEKSIPSYWKNVNKRDGVILLIVVNVVNF